MPDLKIETMAEIVSEAVVHWVAADIDECGHEESEFDPEDMSLTERLFGRKLNRQTDWIAAPDDFDEGQHDTTIKLSNGDVYLITVQKLS